MRRSTFWAMACVFALAMAFPPAIGLQGTIAPRVGPAAALGAPIASASGNIFWGSDQMLPTFPEVQQLDVADVAGAPGDVKLLMATLQGIVNRTQPRIYLIEDAGGEGKYTWLQYLGVPYTLLGYFDVLQKYRSEVTGIIIYDPDVPDTINAATTLAGLRDAIVASPGLAEILQEEPYSLPVVEDLRGRFRDKYEVYSWQYENLWPKTTHRMLIGLSPGRTVSLPPSQQVRFTTVLVETTQERGAANRREYEIDLTPFLGGDAVYIRFEDNFPEDGWGPSVHRVVVEADGEVIVDFIAHSPDEQPYLFEDGRSQSSWGFDGHRYADNDRYFVYEIVPPEGTQRLVARIDMWNQFKVSVTNQRPRPATTVVPYGYLRDYAVANRAMVFWLQPNDPRDRELFEKILSDVEPGTPYLGWFADDVAGEFSGVELTSRYGVYVLAADWFNNMTVFSGTRYRPVEPKKTQVRPLENKIYLTLMFGEGDNLQYNQHHMRVLWSDPNRGKVPLNWTSSPLLVDAAPAILNYYHETATENDYLVAGPSGVGYFYPVVWPIEELREFLKKSAPYLEKSGMPVVYVLNRMSEINVRPNRDIAQAYREYYNPPGIFVSWENQYSTYTTDGSLPIATVRGVGSLEEGLNVVRQIRERWSGDRPMFATIGLLAWNLSPTDAMILVRSLGPEFEVVLADEFFALLRQAMDLPAHEK